MEKRIIEKKINEVAKKIAAEHQPEKIFLFGSWAWGEPTMDSDIDFFIVKDTDNTRKTAMDIDGSVFPRFAAMDFIVYTPKQLKKWLKLKEPFVTKIINQGKLIYARQ